jgi:hypothetical protein
MRRDKAIARILLIFSVANIALAAPAVVRQGRMDVAKAASGKRGGSDDKATDGSGSEPMPELVSDSDESRHWTNSGTEPYFSALGSPLGSPHQGSPPASFHEGPESSRYLPLWPFDADSTTSHDSALASPSRSSHQNSLPESSRHLPLWPFDADSTTSHDSALAPPESTFFNDALKKKIKIFGALGTAAGISTGVIYAVQKKIKGTRSPEAYVSVLFLPSSRNLSID